MKRTSTPICQSPHATFLTLYKEIGDQIFNPENLEQTEYYKSASSLISMFGTYFSATREEHIKYLARNFVNKYNNKAVKNEMLPSSKGYSDADRRIRVYPIRYSNYFQVADGNHRLAIACARGDKKIAVRIMNKPQLTCLQQLLLSVSWHANKKELYQPISSPELGSRWQLVRRCTDRLAMMKSFLTSHGLAEPGENTYLDLACNYGYFVKFMQEFGYLSQGLEVDWAARQIGIHFYHLREDQLIASEIVRFLQSSPPQYDVVSCFSLMHHFVRGFGPISAEKLMQSLDSLTKRVLFFEMGDENEDWFETSLAGWNPTTIKKWLEDNGTFSEVVPLGKDKDRVPPYQGKYGRTLFACLK